ncbi:hypothetical protein HZS_1769 [Henneguya salminicola]|nr:hypothetical protein HZS_1769 [Henneguya salminicola]
MLRLNHYFLLILFSFLIWHIYTHDFEEDFEDSDYFFNAKEYYYVFHLNGNKEQCYFESLEKNSEFTFEVENADGVEGGVIITIDIPHAETKRYELVDQVLDRYSIEEKGVLKFCFISSSGDRKVWMYYSIYGDFVSNSTNYDLTKLNNLLKEVHKSLSSNSNQISHLVHQSHKHEMLLLQKHRFIRYFSMLICFAVVMSSVLQTTIR